MAKVGHRPSINSNTTKMSAWEFNSFGEPSVVLQLTVNFPMPVIKNSNQILIKVMASSLNWMDVLMIRGYGSKMIQSLREQKKGRGSCCIYCSRGNEFPIVLGRDLAGTVTQVGSDVKNFKIGDQVYGFVAMTDIGSHAEYCVVDKDWIQPKPDFLSFAQAASIPFVSLTVWSAFRNAGNFVDLKDKTFLILGASGGVGTIAVQYLKHHGARVTTTSNSNAFTLLNDMGADYMIDYCEPDHEKTIASHGPYDCILDLTGGLADAQNLYGRSGTGQYITLISPTIQNIDYYGQILGPLKTKIDKMSTCLGSYFSNQVATRWAFFSANKDGWKEITELVKQKKIKPVVEQTFKFSDLIKAYERMDMGHLRGKIIIESKVEVE